MFEENAGEEDNCDSWSTQDVNRVFSWADGYCGAWQSINPSPTASYCRQLLQTMMSMIVSHWPVPNLWKSWSSLESDSSSWCSLHLSLWRFLEFSWSTALSSRSVADSVNSGSRKNWANLESITKELCQVTTMFEVICRSRLSNIPQKLT